MRILLLFTVFTLGSATRAKGGGAGTQTVLLIKGGVGFDVNLLSTTPQTVRHSGKDLKPQQGTEDAIEFQPSELEGEQKVASDLTASLQNTVDSSKKLQEQIASLKGRAVKAEKLLGKKDKELQKVQKKEAAAEKSLQVKSKMLLHERHESDLLKKKVKDLEQDIEVSNRAWKEAADHEKEVAEEAKETAKEEAAKNDRLSQQMSEKSKEKVAVAAPKAKPSHSKFMKSLKKDPVKSDKKRAVKLNMATSEDQTEAVDESVQAKDLDEESAQIDQSDIDMQQDVAPDAVSEATSEDQTEVPAEDEAMPVAEEQPVEKAVVKPPMVHATGGAADAHTDAGSKVAATDSLDPMPPSDDAPALSDAEDSGSDEDKAVDSSADAQASETPSAADSTADKEDDSSWNLAYSPADRAAVVEESVEGEAVEKEMKEAESEDVLSPNAPEPVEEDPRDTFDDKGYAPDPMGRI